MKIKEIPIQGTFPMYVWYFHNKNYKITRVALAVRLRERSKYSLTVLWPRIIMAKNGKKHLKYCNYHSAIKFELAGVGINTIILYFIDKN